MSRPFLIAIIDDEEFQIKTLTRKLRIFFCDTTEIEILAFTNTSDFINCSQVFDYHIVDYEIELNCNGVDLIKKTKLKSNGVVFTGNTNKIKPEEHIYLSAINFKVIEKPKTKEVIDEAIRYFLSKTL